MRWECAPSLGQLSSQVMIFIPLGDMPWNGPLPAEAWQLSTARRARRLRCQMTMPVTESAATTSPIAEMKMRPGKPGDAARMQRELNLQEEVAGSAAARESSRRYSGHPRCRNRAWAARRRPRHDRRRLEEADAEDAVGGRIEDVAGRRLEASPPGFRLRVEEDLRIGHLGLDELVVGALAARVVGRRREAREEADDRLRELAIEIEGGAADRQDEQERPGPQAEGAVDIEIDPVGGARAA